ncbi:MAG: diadenylate cyclase CdaA [Oscillospiraceae bacterium]|nr:diadenylate cyclase CdaA [Oscillospiraceae bacterium]
MEAISSGLSRAANLFATIGITDIIDILIVAYLIYRAIWFVRRTNSYNLAKGLLLVLAALGISYVFGLTMINFLLRKTVELGLIALVILFQPELRRVLERMGRSFSTSRTAASPMIETAIAQIVLACTEMSASRTGALLIFERTVNLNAIMGTGTVLNADVTAELVKNLFFNKAPLHDGAVIIRGGRIAAAGCVLPLTQSTNLSKELGMRHRAGIGLSEQSDAVVVIVSEETGSISVAIDGMLKRHLTAATLDKLLHNELVTEEEDDSRRNFFYNSIRKLFKVKKDEQNESSEKTV